MKFLVLVAVLFATAVSAQDEADNNYIRRA